MTKRANVLTVSLIAIFAVTSVRAEIASKAYVDQQVDSVEAKVDTHTANTTMHITAAERTAWNAKEDVSNKVVTPSSISESDYESVEKYPSMAVAQAMIEASADDLSDDISSLSDRVTTAEGDIAGLESGKADKATTLAGYGITNAYTKSEVDSDLALKQDKSDSTVAANGNYIKAGSDVKANLGLLDTRAKANADAISAETTRATTAEGAINTKIGTVTEGKTVVQMIQDAQSAATYDDTALAGRVTATEGAITTLNGDASTTGSVAKKISDAITGLNLSTTYQAKSDSTVAANGNYIKAGSDVKGNLGYLDSQAKSNADAISAETTRATTAEGAINTKIGTVTEGKTVVQMIQDAQSAATYDDTALAGRVTAVETGKADKATTLAGYGITNAYTKSEVDTSLGNKQNKSDSTATAGNYIAAGTGVGANLGALDTQLKTTTDTANAAIPKPSGTCTDCVLHFNGTAYAWEEVGR